MSTLFQEALVDARKLREVATAEAKAAVLEAVAPTIKQMIDREIAGLILEQEEPAPVPDMPVADAPMPPEAPNPDAGATGPISPAPASGEAPAPATPMPPAVAAASPPIVSPNSQVLGTIEAGPTGEQQIVIPVDALFQKTAAPAADATGEVPPAPPAPDAAPLDPAAAAVEPPPPPAAETPAPQPEEPAAPAPPIAEMVARLLSEQTSKASPASSSTETYASFRNRLTEVESLVESARRNKVDPTGVKPIETKINELRKTLSVLKENNAISRRLFVLNEDRLGLLHESLQFSTIYPQEKGTQMAKTNDSSVKALIRTLLEGAEGFEQKVGKVSPAGDSEGIDDNHAKAASGNTAKIKADAERAKFPTKEKKDWPGKPSPESLLEQLEEEVAELMAEMDMGAVEEGGDSMSDDMVLEMDDKEIVAEAKKAKARIKALREQAEAAESEEAESEGEDTDLEVLNDEEGAEEAVDDSLTLTIDLDGVSGAEVDNVNVSLDGEALDGTETEEGDMDMDLSDAGDMDMGGDAEEEGAPMLSESARRGKKPTASDKLVNENKVLRAQLQETQLLTARSLYVNKLFVREGLTGTQKRKIVEYLDSARTVAEAKELYNRVARVLDKGAKKAGMVSESAGRRSAEMLNEAAQPCFDTSRWQVLAGVKKTSK